MRALDFIPKGDKRKGQEKQPLKSNGFPKLETKNKG